ncbi:hypothetical protein SERLA73DRAFT_180531 [Serpula lacrymans var. lacrymans S7.3]|uniref:Uncharacterized protein n=1 Tax=Serpula lacrymans var. lacrymans (strain S7.3) TaxID=936435 RepID=F8PV21_SERL3|nr:hypothetical protein SERLA73DRAFT_180531 [Serpula lacrymans var. lacrymans S7.3]
MKTRANEMSDNKEFPTQKDDKPKTTTNRKRSSKVHKEAHKERRGSMSRIDTALISEQSRQPHISTESHVQSGSRQPRQVHTFRLGDRSHRHSLGDPYSHSGRPSSGPTGSVPLPPRSRRSSMPVSPRSMIQHAWHTAMTADPLIDSDEENPDEHVRLDYVRRLHVIRRLRGKQPNEPEDSSRCVQVHSPPTTLASDPRNVQ